MRVLLICLTLTCLSCAKKLNNVEQNSVVIANKEQTIENILGTDNTELDNINKTLTLVYQNNDEATRTTKYIVLDKINNSVLLKGSFKAGYVKWKTDTSLEILDIPGIIPNGKKQSDYIKTINIPTQNK